MATPKGHSRTGHLERKVPVDADASRPSRKCAFTAEANKLLADIAKERSEQLSPLAEESSPYMKKQ